jgi:hypothetical protein
MVSPELQAVGRLPGRVPRCRRLAALRPSWTRRRRRRAGPTGRELAARPRLGQGFTLFAPDGGVVQVQVARHRHVLAEHLDALPAFATPYVSS